MFIKILIFFYKKFLKTKFIFLVNNHCYRSFAKNNNKSPDAGRYVDVPQNQKINAEKAIPYKSNENESPFFTSGVITADDVKK